MNKFTEPSKPFVMRIDRNSNTMEIEWTRDIENADRIFQNFTLFDIALTEYLKDQVLSLCQKKSIAVRCDKIKI